MTIIFSGRTSRKQTSTYMTSKQEQRLWQVVLQLCQNSCMWHHTTLIGNCTTYNISYNISTTWWWKLTSKHEETAQACSDETQVLHSVPWKEWPERAHAQRQSGLQQSFVQQMVPRGQKSSRWAPDVRSMEAPSSSGGQAEKLGEKRHELKNRKLRTEVILKTYWVSKVVPSAPASPSKRWTRPRTDSQRLRSRTGPWSRIYNFSAHGVLPDRATCTPCPGSHPILAELLAGAVDQDVNGQLRWELFSGTLTFSFRPSSTHHTTNMTPSSCEIQLGSYSFPWNTPNRSSVAAPAAATAHTKQVLQEAGSGGKI